MKYRILWLPNGYNLQEEQESDFADKYQLSRGFIQQTAPEQSPSQAKIELNESAAFTLITKILASF